MKKGFRAENTDQRMAGYEGLKRCVNEKVDRLRKVVERVDG